MKITSVNKTLNFRGQNQDVNFDATKKEKRKNTLTPLQIGLFEVLVIPMTLVLL